MLDSTQIQARNLIVEQIEKLEEKYKKKAEKEKVKKISASVKYKGETYSSDAELQEAYACDVFDSDTYDKLLDKLDKARGNIDEWAMTPTECLVLELDAIRVNILTEMKHDELEKKRKAEQDARAEELSAEGYSYNEIQAIIGNEERMRFE